MSQQKQFEEDFPSLKEKALEEIGKVKGVSIVDDKLFFDYDLNLPFFSAETIMAVCLDKSKVKRAIDVLSKKYQKAELDTPRAVSYPKAALYNGKWSVLDELLKELGL